jgi:hypothetical protein
MQKLRWTERGWSRGFSYCSWKFQSRSGVGRGRRFPALRTGRVDSPTGAQKTCVLLRVDGSTRRRGAHDFRQSSAAAPKRGLCRIEFSGIIGTATSAIFPGFAGTPARLHWRVSCFWVLTSPKISANQRAVPARVGLLPIRVNAGRTSLKEKLIKIGAKVVSQPRDASRQCD